MEFIRLQDFQTFNLTELRNLFPNISFCFPIKNENLIDLGFRIVTTLDRPLNTIDITYELGPITTDGNGNYIRDWIGRPSTTEEKQERVNYREFWFNFKRSNVYTGLRTRARQSLTFREVMAEWLDELKDGRYSGDPDEERIQELLNDMIIELNPTQNQYDQIGAAFTYGNLNAIYSLPGIGTT